MGKKSKSAKPAADAVPKRWAEAKDMTFDVSKHIEKEQEIEFGDLRVDLDQQYGQVRGIDQKHVIKMFEDFKMNPPVRLSLTVWRHPGL
jgi:hypothetical protein